MKMIIMNLYQSNILIEETKKNYLLRKFEIFISITYK